MENLSISVTCLTQFADELLEHIFCSSILDFKDIISLSLTCRRFLLVSQSREIWRQKLLSRWPKLVQPIDGENIHMLFIKRHTTEKYLIEKLRRLARASFHYDEVVPFSLLAEFKELYAFDKEYLPVVLDILFAFVCERDDTGDINRKYYSRKVYQYIYHDKLREVWMELLESTTDHAEMIEKGAILISQWCNPELRISGDDISKKLDEIAMLVKEVLPKQLSSPSPYDKAVIIVNAINRVLYHDLGFKGNRNSYYDLNNSFIHKVLERKLGIPISLAVLYISVARRLGLNMQGINFPGHFLIRIMLENIEKCPIYIDAFDKGALLDQDQCIIKFVSNVDQYHWPKDVLFQPADKRNFFVRMVNNIINILKESTVLDSQNLPALCAAHELMFLLDPDNEENKVVLTKIYVHQGISLEDVAEKLSVMFPSNRNALSNTLNSFQIISSRSRKHAKIPLITPKYRSSPENKEVKYRVGSLMKHKRYNYVCVIYGWDPICRMDEVWQAQMGVHRLEDKDQQPFYHVLAHDGSSRYAAQESILPTTTDSPISHPEVGKYFKSFKVDHYVFTDELNEAYPEDRVMSENT